MCTVYSMLSVYAVHLIEDSCTVHSMFLMYTAHCKYGSYTVICIHV